MGDAYDAACEALHDRGRLFVREFIAQQIVSVAADGERDPVRLCAMALAAVAYHADLATLQGPEAGAPGALQAPSRIMVDDGGRD